MEAVDSSVTLVHLPDYTAQIENLSIKLTKMLALFRAIIVLYSENQAKYRDLRAAARRIYVPAASNCGWKIRGRRLETIQTAVIVTV
jgi:hypothetical protein